jgi:hypothetical protein
VSNETLETIHVLAYNLKVAPLDTYSTALSVGKRERGGPTLPTEYSGAKPAADRQV